MKCTQPSNTCECPCYTDANYDACSNSFTLSYVIHICLSSRYIFHRFTKLIVSINLSYRDVNPKPCIPEDVTIDIFEQLMYEYQEFEASTDTGNCYDSSCSDRDDEG